ncbi:hypothetical protein N658DRAFT_495192 [Parathielavia hyrcaniae]|uniref:Uncharacterized protein n=1 Tax=Parathielavia hyrcaniae TaxID=113614 RepID=A0AAN6Q2T3_9PEZI|nr:hypothetical protein N658DRAFT_495192 [Parathielavia hyrcaniae]
MITLDRPQPVVVKPLEVGSRHPSAGTWAHQGSESIPVRHMSAACSHSHGSYGSLYLLGTATLWVLSIFWNTVWRHCAHLARLEDAYAK